LHKLMTTICLLSRAPGSVVVLIAFIYIFFPTEIVSHC
jgi:hypothetical protein